MKGKILHGLFHLLALAAQYGNLASGYVPVKYQPLVAAGVAALQAGVALANHSSSQPAK